MGRTKLQKVAALKDVDEVRRLLRPRAYLRIYEILHGVKYIDAKDSFYGTALSAAIGNENEVNVATAAASGNAIAGNVARQRNDDVIEVLLDAGASPDGKLITTHLSEESPLTLACFNERRSTDNAVRLINTLAFHGANLDLLYKHPLGSLPLLQIILYRIPFTADLGLGQPLNPLIMEHRKNFRRYAAIAIKLVHLGASRNHLTDELNAHLDSLPRLLEEINSPTIRRQEPLLSQVEETPQVMPNADMTRQTIHHLPPTVQGFLHMADTHAESARARALPASRSSAKSQIDEAIERLKEQNKDLDSIGKIPKGFLCPLTLDIMRDPVFNSLGRTFDRASIEGWFNTGKITDPITNAKCTQILTPNIDLKSEILQFLEDAITKAKNENSKRPKGSDSLTLT